MVISIKSTIHPELELRTATVEDIPAVRAVFQNPANAELDPVTTAPETYTYEKVEGMVKRWIKEQGDEKPRAITVVVVVNGAVQGVGGMGHIATDAETGKRTGDAGVMLNEAARGKGYGSEAMQLTTDYAFDMLKLDKVTVTMLAKNQPMINVMRKMGWKGRHIPEGPGATFGDECIFEMLPEEWAEKRKAEKA